MPLSGQLLGGCEPFDDLTCNPPGACMVALLIKSGWLRTLSEPGFNPVSTTYPHRLDIWILIFDIYSWCISHIPMVISSPLH